MASRIRSSSNRAKSNSVSEKTLLSKKQPLEIIPSEVVFKDIEANQYYEITVQIRNLTSRATRIRIQETSNPNFKIIYNMQPEIAPGLSMTAKVKYQCKEVKNQTEVINIVSEDGNRIQLPVRVYKMESQILFEPFVNMGFLRLGKEHVETIAIKNSGKAYSTVEFTHNHGTMITIEPKVLRISPMETSKIMVKYKPAESGLFKGVIHLNSDSILVKNQIDIHATPVEFARFVVDDKGNQITSFDFGTLCTGKQNFLQAFIVNNSPKAMKFKTFFRKGYLSTGEQFALVQTPSEIGQQQSERVMFLEPEFGSIEPFTEFEIKIICNTRVSYRDRIFTKNYALSPVNQQGTINQMKNSSDFKPQVLHEYSILMTIEDDEPMILQLKAQANCPLIKLGQNVFKFGDCSLNENREIEFEVENRNNTTKAQVSFPKIPNFHVSPSNYFLKPMQKQTFKAIFEPKTIGKLDTTQILLINRLYDIQMRFFGISTSLANKSQIKDRPQSFKQSGKESPKKVMPIKTRGKAFSLADQTFMSEMRKSTQQQHQMKVQLTSLMENRTKFNQYLTDRRTERFEKDKEEKVQKKWSVYQKKLKELGVASKLSQKLDDEGLSNKPPIDYEFETGMIETKISKQQVNLPEAKEKLFVTRHILDYEPPVVSKGKAEQFCKQIIEAPKKIWPEHPLNYNHKREVAMSLSPEELSRIEVSTNLINFGQVYIKSISKRYFWLRNSTNKAIEIQLAYHDTELHLSYKKPQIVTPNGQVGFEIVFNKDTLGDFRSTIKYTINSQHEFEMSITAKCIPVCILIDKSSIKFNYDENSLQASARQIVKLTNPGNSPAVYRFALGKERLFVPSILQGKLGPKQVREIPIFFTPPEIKSQKNEYTFNERLVLKVIDGPQDILMCSCTLHDPKFNLKGLTVANPILCVGHELNDVIQVKNTSKHPIVLHISGITVSITEKVKLSPDESKKFRVTFFAKQSGTFNAEINIQPRCGIKKTLETTIKVIEPNLSFSPEDINMGVLVVQGIPGQANLVIKNRSQIEMCLIIDLRPNSIQPMNPKFIENLNLKLKTQGERLDVISPTRSPSGPEIPQFAQGENIVGMQVNEDQFENSEDDEQEIRERNEDEYRKYRLLLKPNKDYEFALEFFPKQIDSYEIEIPMFIQGSQIDLQNLPVLRCQGIKPQFIFEPSVIDFKRKIVTKPQRCYPKFINITVSNIDDVDCQWELRDHQIRKQGIFAIQLNKGVLKPKETIQIRTSFNPFTIGEYFYKMPLYIKTSKLAEPLKYVDVICKGFSTSPNLYFNKREVIMPVVPLDIETTSSFKILNDGYENCSLKYQFLDDVANLGVTTSFPDGTNIGITKQKLRVDLSWKSSKPISFCLKLEFTDDLNRTFVVPISGTADNCIFTNYTYFLRNEGRFHIKSEGTLKMVQGTQGLTIGRKGSAHSFKSNATARSVMSYLGVNPISATVLSNTINYINRYLNANLLTVPIKDFPGSFIEHDGNQIFEILAFVSSKKTNFPWKYSPSSNEQPGSRVDALFNQYNQLIRMLKIEGAHLNHIRPEYLLSYSDLNYYLGHLPEEKSKSYMPSLLKINSGLYNYLSMQAWITLLYQIFKIYILARVTLKNFKSHLPNLPDVPKSYLQQSNFTSSAECMLFFWVEQAILEVLLEQRRLTNFDKDFKDGIAIAALLQKYAGLNVMKKMKMICTSESDYRDNAQVLCEGLAEIGLQNHITTKDICYPLQRQLLLFILHLYVYLPFYVPKRDPVVFKCILGEEVVRTLQLTNPSNKPVTYQVKYEGSEDFKLMSDPKFRMQPQQVYKFQIKFVSRISAEVNGKLMFINIKEDSLTAAALVFELKSEIVGRTNDRIWNISSILYEQVQFQIEVFNKFTGTEMVDFAISYETEYIFDGRSKQKSGQPPLPKEQQIRTIYGKYDNVKIRRNATASITLNYIPINYYTTKTTVFFLNPIVGEFQHEVIATVEPPGTISEARPPMSLCVDDVVNWQLEINPRNQQLIRARKVIQTLKRAKKGAAVKDKPAQVLPVKEVFNVQMPPNPYINAKSSIRVCQKGHEEKKSKEEIVDSDNKIPFTLMCKNPVYEFTTYVLLSNQAKTDVRRYKIILTVQPKPLKAILEMNVPARGEVTQNLPIVNNTERDWSIKVQWEPDASKNGNYFIVNPQYTSSFPVKRNSIGNFPITFKPKWAHEAQARLTMNNPLTLDQFEYQIIGKGQQPLAEEHIQIKCEAKQKVKKQIIVKNPYQEKAVTFNVETDLMNCKAPAKLTIPAGAKEKIEFTVQPMLCGEYTGSITFFEEEGPQYIWFTISVTTNYPEPYKTLSIESEIRQKLVTELHIPYEHQEESSFQVAINGSGLIGHPTCAMKPHHDNTYLLEYLPTEVGVEQGSICFINPGVGEVLFELNLKCHPKPVVNISNLKSPLGVSTSVYVELENTTQSRAIIKVINSNPDQFIIKYGTIRLQAQEKRKIQIEYVPASLDSIESARIEFISKEIGDWKYELSGSGQTPVPFPAYNVYNGLLEEHSDSIKFRNPFKYEIVVGVKLIDQSSNNVFEILTHGKNKFQINVGGVLQIPFSFRPNSCKMFTCKIIVMITEKIYWTFPIRGRTEVNEGKIIANLVSQCRQSISEFVQLTLEGVEYSKDNAFEYSFENVPRPLEKIIEKSLLVDFSKDSLRHAQDKLEMEFMFKPMKPLKCSFDLLITKREGSRWRYRVCLEGSEPEVDDLIEIESNLLVTSTVSFKITNTEKAPAAFKARFTSDSAHEFSVEPKQGMLAQYGAKGTSFFVSYTPVEYGKEKKGKLIIETADMYWSYLLKGSLPKYIPPKLEGSRSRIHSTKK